MRSRFIFILFCTTAFFSCSDDGTSGTKGPIILGDSSTIVTESDPQYLQDFVADIKMVKQSAPPVSEPGVAAPADSAAPATAAPASVAPAESGLTVAFKEATIFIPGIETKTYTTQDLTNAPGASYEITDGQLQGNELRIVSGDVDKISQRYQTIVIAKNELGILVLESLSELDEWRPVKGKGNVYPVSGLGKKELEYKSASKATIRNAVTKAARSAHLSRATQNKWVNSVKNVKAVNQKPLSVALRSVMWKIEGKAANGRRFQKQLRIDIPVQ